MTLTHRRILTFILFLLLISVGPGLIFYGAGYRVNIKQKRIERVGLLHITTDPENTTITIDGQSHPISNELVLSSLQPKEYDIVISKNEYHSWYKRLEIFPGESTFIRDLQLFVDNPTELITSITQNPVELATTNDYAYFQSANSLMQFAFASEKLTQHPLANQFEIINFQTDSSGKAVFLQNAIWYYFDGSTIAPLDVRYLKEDVSKIFVEGNLLHIITESGIYSASPQEENASLIVQQSFIQTLFVANTQYWFIAYEPSKKHSFLYKVVNEQSRPELITTLPYQDQYLIKENFDGFLTLSSPEELKIILVDSNTLPAITEEIRSIKNWQWSKNRKQLLVATDFELLIFHYNEARRQELLMRLSKPFSDAAWETNETHTFYIADDQLQLVERDERFQRNTILLTEKLPELQILATPISGKTIYLTSINSNGELSILKQNLR